MYLAEVLPFVEVARAEAEVAQASSLRGRAEPDQLSAPQAGCLRHTEPSRLPSRALPTVSRLSVAISIQLVLEHPPIEQLLNHRHNLRKRRTFRGHLRDDLTGRRFALGDQIAERSIPGLPLQRMPVRTRREGEAIVMSLLSQVLPERHVSLPFQLLRHVLVDGPLQEGAVLGGVPEGPRRMNAVPVRPLIGGSARADQLDAPVH